MDFKQPTNTPVSDDDLVRVLKHHIVRVRAIYLFGSRATGHATPNSDWDIGVISDTPLKPEFLWAVSGACADVCQGPVDLIDLRSASTVLQHQVITQGRCLYHAGDVHTQAFELYILSEKTALDEARAGLMGDITRRGFVYGR